MHARAAYIRSFGTTGILLVASLLMLAMVGAVVGFHRWPGGSVVQTVPSVPLNPTSAAHLRAVRPAGSVVDVHKTPVDHATHLGRRRATTAGLVKVVRVRSPHAVGYPVAISPGALAPGTAAPSQPSAGGSASPDQPRTPTPPTPPPAPQPLATLVDEIVQSAPSGIPQSGQPVQIHLPLAGVPTIETPPLP